MHRRVRYAHKKLNFASLFARNVCLSTKFNLRLKKPKKRNRAISKVYYKDFGNCLMSIFFIKQKHRFFHHQTVLLESNSRRIEFKYFFNQFSKLYENCMPRIFPNIRCMELYDKRFRFMEVNPGNFCAIRLIYLKFQRHNYVTF